MSNILAAIKNIINDHKICIQNKDSGYNRANNMGAALEEFIKNSFANTLNENDEMKRIIEYEKTFSYLGNQNNPPDIILKNGDAIEVKKIQSLNSSLALNSSFPKNKLYVDDTRITDECKNCEIWSEKDIIYIIGSVKDKKLKTIWFVYGDCYAADKKTYQRIADTISNGLHNIPDIDFAKTKELGGIKHVDPLGISNLRIRGMWHIEHPCKVFSYLPLSNHNNDNMKLYCVMKKDKYLSFSDEDRQELEKVPNLKISFEKIKNPNNPSQLMECVFMEYDCGE